MPAPGRWRWGCGEAKPSDIREPSAATQPAFKGTLKMGEPLNVWGV
jgi:hypothetical protein